MGLMAVFALGNLATVFAPTYATLMLARFVAGVPHGAYFGIAALVAAQLLGPGNRAKAVAQVMTGPDRGHRRRCPRRVLAGPDARLAQRVRAWSSHRRRHAARASASGCRTSAPRTHQPADRTRRAQRPQVWLALIVGMVGFGGMFAVYTYVATTLTDVAGLSRPRVPLALMVFGSGMVVGNLVGGRMADWSVIRGLYAGHGPRWAWCWRFSWPPRTILAPRWLLLFAIGASGAAIAPALQTRLMDVAADAQTLAAALNHSALNIANASGAWVGGPVIAAGFGYTAPAAAGAGLAARRARRADTVGPAAAPHHAAGPAGSGRGALSGVIATDDPRLQPRSADTHGRKQGL